MLPSVFVDLEINEKAFVIASIKLKIEEDKKQQAKLKKGKK
jgi:hypothetical protein